jgi:hypothetical protein
MILALPFAASQHGVHADPAENTRDRRLDSHRQIGIFVVLGFFPFRGQVSSLQPPVTRAVGQPNDDHSVKFIND